MIDPAKRAALSARRRPAPPEASRSVRDEPPPPPPAPPPPPDPPAPPEPPAPAGDQELSPKALEEVVEAGLEKLYAAAREDFNVFAELVMVDDETGKPIRQAPIHRRWAQLCEEYDRLLIWSHINSGKTTQLSTLRAIWELGRDVTLRILILSNTATIATKIVRNIAELIESNEAVRKVFPHLEPHPNGPWTQTELKVKRPGNSKDPSVRAMGVHGSLTGARVDRLIVDDILDPENTATEAARKKVSGWYKAVAVGRGSTRLRIVVVGTAYHPSDLLHELARQPRWKAFRFPVINAKGKVAWPSLWPPERIERMREELGPAEFARQLLCRARDDEEARFKKAWIDEALRRGEGLDPLFSLDEVPEGWAVYTGVDIGVGKKKRNDLTAFFTFLEDPKGHRRVLWIESGKYTGPEIVQKIFDHHMRYHSTIAVENNAAQQFILDFANKDFNIPVLPHTTTREKRDPRMGVEGLAIELFNRKWTIPCHMGKAVPEIEAWIVEMLFYSPLAHTGDRLMASYFGRDLARRLSNKNLPEVRMRLLGSENRENQPVSSY